MLKEFLPLIVGIVAGIIGWIIGSTIWRQKLKPLQDSFDASEKKVEDLTLKLNRQKNKYTELQQGHQDIRQKADDLARKYALLEKEAKALRIAKEGAERKYKTAQRNDDAELIDLRQQNASLTGQLAEMDDEMNALKAQLTNTRFEKNQAQENLAAIKSDGTEQAKGESNKIKRLQSDVDQLRRQTGASAALVKQLEIEKAQLTAKIVELEGDLAGGGTAAEGGTTWAAEKTTLEARITELEAQVAAVSAVSETTTEEPAIEENTPAPVVTEPETVEEEEAPVAQVAAEEEEITTPAPEEVEEITTEPVAAVVPDPDPENVVEEVTAPVATTKITLPSGSSIKQDDLKMVEGIGPKIEELLHAADIKTWQQLAEAPVEQVQQILDDAGPNYRIHQPTTWAKQAQLATEAKWEELEAYQDHLIGGREPEA